jgi:hypothetical protein
LQQIQFCENHTGVWLAAPTAIGLTAAQVNALRDATEYARGAYDDAQAARQAAKAATGAYYAAVRDMRDIAAELVGQIKAFADLSANPPAVYTAAQIPAPAAPSPVPAPGRPVLAGVTLEPTGAVTLNWTADNAAASTGAFFNIFRRLPGQSGYASIGGAPGSTSASRTMSFTDTSVPTSAAASGATYIIIGQRGTKQGTPSDAITVQFGVEGGGGTFKIGDGQGMKIAA